MKQHKRSRYVATPEVAGDRQEHDEPARSRFGGIQWGACFFGWLVAVGVSILLISIIGAVVGAAGSSAEIIQSDAERDAGTIGVTAAVVLLVVLAIGYYAGGYVAGRMSRFDAARQGIGVWIIGVLVVIVSIVGGVGFGSQYNILDRVDLPNLPLSNEQIGWGALLTTALALVITFLSATLGGKVGHRYHDHVDTVAGRPGIAH